MFTAIAVNIDSRGDGAAGARERGYRAAMSGDREHELVLFGATSFVGELTAAHLARHAPAGTRIALAGRSRERLEKVRDRLPSPGGDWPLIVADTTDPDALARMAASTTALLTTVGPYAKYGLPVVEACATAGTHYADLTGEVQFAREAIDRFDEPARASGARIVHSCGYDSIPSDLSVLLLHSRVQADGEGELTDVTTVARIRGGVSGGTVDSMRGLADGARADRSLARLMRDPYGLSPERDAEPDTRQPSDNPAPHRVDGRWVAPFVMASYNTRIVRRSNAIAGYAYGKGLRYGEVMGTGRARSARSPRAWSRAGWAPCSPGSSPRRPAGARPRPAQAGRGAEREDPQRRVVPPRHRRDDHHRRALHRARLGLRRPRLRGHRRDVRRDGALPRPRRRPPARPRRLAHPRHGDGPGARGAPAHRRATCTTSTGPECRALRPRWRSTPGNPPRS